MTGILYFIIVGIVAGFLAGLVMRGGGFGWLVNLIVGIAGAILGGWLFGKLGWSFGNGMVGEIITSFLGAVILLFVIGLFKKK